jgi:hypothetical protein
MAMGQILAECMWAGAAGRDSADWGVCSSFPAAPILGEHGDFPNRLRLEVLVPTLLLEGILQGAAPDHP